MPPFCLIHNVSGVTVVKASVPYHNSLLSIVKMEELKMPYSRFLQLTFTLRSAAPVAETVNEP